MAHTKEEWKLVWWGNEKHPYPFNITADNENKWITRHGTVSSKENALLMASAPDLLEACKEALKYFDQVNFRGANARQLQNSINKAEGR